MYYTVALITQINMLLGKVVDINDHQTLTGNIVYLLVNYLLNI